MKKSYTFNYLKIYLWKGLSIILNFISMFIVIPKLSAMPVVYGIYMVCISITIFLSYADMGFMRAGYKYASEYYAQNKLIKEIKVIGLASFILFLFVSVFAILFLTASFYPKLLIKNFSNQAEIEIASKLLLIVAVFSYTTVLQRFNQTIFGIRVEDYLYQQIQILVSVIKILSVFYFFNNRYDIVGYFLFFQIMNLLGNVVGAIRVKFRYNYDFGLLFKNFRYSKKTFTKVKKLGFASLYVALMWVIFFQLDYIVIGKFLGAESVAYFAIGFTILTYFRTISTTIYGPFSARFNHYVGENNIVGLKKFYCHVITITMPIILFPIISSLVLIKPLILSWVGDKYLLSINIAFFLLLGSLSSFISIPSSIIVVAQEKINRLFIINTTMVIIYWLGILITVKYWHLESFAIFKFISLIVAGIFYYVVSIKILEMKARQFFIKILSPIAIPTIFLILSLAYIGQFMPVEKSSANLAIVVLTGGVFSILAVVLYYFQSSVFKVYINKLFKDVRCNWLSIFKFQ